MSEENKRRPAKWELSETDPDKAGQIKDALRMVRDPEMGYSVIELGLIRNVVFDEKRLMVTMILTTPFCPYAPEMVEQVRTAVESVVNDPVAIDLRMDAWDQDMMEEGFELDWGLF